MAYITNSITSANPSADLYTAMAAALTTAGYTLVDTVVISTRTHKIWKSAAANNSQALDWYLDVCYTTTGAGNMWLFPMEFYDPATDLAYRMVYSGTTSTNVEQTYFSALGASGFTLEAASWPANASNATVLAVTTSTSAFSYWISVLGDRVIVLTSAAPSVLVYSGFFLTHAGHASIATSADYPLVYASLLGTARSSATSAASTAMALTRMPRVATGTASWGSNPSTSVSTFNSPNMPGQIPTAVPYLAAPVPVYGYTTGVQAWSGLYGYFRDVYSVNADTVARGDTCIVDGATHVLTTPASNVSYMFKAA